MNGCLFCKIVAGEVPADIVYEDADVLTFLDINPVNPGHTLVIPKEHHEHMYGTPDHLLEKLMVATKKVGNAVWKATNADGMNLGCNTGKEGGQVIPHTHFHIMPRYKSDTYELWHGEPYATDEERASVADKIRKNV